MRLVRMAHREMLLMTAPKKPDEIAESDRLHDLPFPAWRLKAFGHYHQYPNSRIHDFLDVELPRLDRERGQRLCVLAPRGASKSGVVTLEHVLYSAIEHGEPFTWIMSDTQPMTRQHLHNIGKEVLYNEKLIAQYPHIVGDSAKVSADRITLGNGSIIAGYSTGQNVRGQREGAARPSVIVVDDPEGEGDVISPTRRTHNLNWFNDAVLKAGDENTNIIVLGTAICPGCLVLDIARRPGWNAKIFKAIEKWPENMVLWMEWRNLYLHAVGADEAAKQTAMVRARAFYDANREKMDHGAELTWDKRYPLYDLMCEWAENERSFHQERQNDPHNPEATEWPASYFDWDGFWFSDWPDDVTLRVMALDPSKGVTARVGDYSAYIMLARCGRGFWWVEADLARRPVTQIARDGIILAKRFEKETNGRLDGFVVESNQFQELLADPILAEAERNKVLLPLYQFNNLIHKDVRIRRLTSDLNRRLMRFRRTPSTMLLVEQMKEWPGGQFDDGPDAAEQARRLATELWQGRAKR